MNYLIFSLWGDKPMFCAGAVRNAQKAKEHYPDWVCRFYVDKTVPEAVRGLLVAAGCELKEMPANQDYSGLFWRMMPLVSRDCDYFSVKDCDAMIGAREAAADREWLKSGQPFHIMRDHPNHKNPIMGGMWGARGGFLGILQGDVRKRITIPQAFNNDQIYLEMMVWPLIKKCACIHDDRKTFDAAELSFSVRMKTNYDFVGNKYKENGQPVYTLESR
jgi:hypothetical protein